MLAQITQYATYGIREFEAGVLGWDWDRNTENI